jgi:hypothetical protein
MPKSPYNSPQQGKGRFIAVMTSLPSSSVTSAPHP